MGLIKGTVNVISVHPALSVFSSQPLYQPLLHPSNAVNRRHCGHCSGKLIYRVSHPAHRSRVITWKIIANKFCMGAYAIPCTSITHSDTPFFHSIAKIPRLSPRSRILSPMYFHHPFRSLYWPLPSPYGPPPNSPASPSTLRAP